MIDEKEKLIGAISVLVDDDRLIEIMEQADAADDPVALLQQEYHALTANGDAKSSSAEDVEIVPVILHVVDQRTREMTELTTGYELKRMVGDMAVYAGLTLSWGPRYKSVPFPTVDDAERGARVWRALESQRIIQTPVIRQTLVLHVAQEIREQTKPQQFNVRLTLDETRKMEAILVGLRVQNEELAPKNPVDSYPDVLRWLLSQIQVA